MLATRGMGGPRQLLATAGHGRYSVVIVEPPDELEPGVGGGRKQFQVSPKKIWLRKTKPEARVKYEDIFPEEFVLEIEGEDYELVEGKPPTAAQAIATLPIKELEEKIERAQKALGVSKSVAKKALQKRAAKELRGLKQLQSELAADDEDFFILLMLADM